MMERKLVQDVVQREGLGGADQGSRAHGELEPAVAHQEELRAQLPACDGLQRDVAHDLRRAYDDVAREFKSYDWSSVEAAVGAAYKKYPTECPYPSWVNHHFKASSECLEFLINAVAERIDDPFSSRYLSLITHVADTVVPRQIADPDFKRELEQLNATSDSEKLQAIFGSLREIADRARHLLRGTTIGTPEKGIGKLPPDME